MKTNIFVVFVGLLLAFCTEKPAGTATKPPVISLVGTWRLLTGTLIEKGDTVVTDYTQKVSFIKIINDTHFAFLHHDLKRGKDAAAVFSAGGGSYTLQQNRYTERLEYCSDSAWEGHDFTFTVVVSNDTLTQTGVEKVESAGVNRINIEKYVRSKK
jgi:hypothetical protein